MSPSNLKRLKVLVIIGGKSPEHQISLISGHNIIENLDETKYIIEVVGIDPFGRWKYYKKEKYVKNVKNPAKVSLTKSNTEVVILERKKGHILFDVKKGKKITNIDVVFPVLHGRNGEDGTIQGYFRMLSIPFVGTDVMASAIGMDKEVSKRLWRDAGIPIAKFDVVTHQNKDVVTYDTYAKKLGKTLFIKPANAGSAVGVHKVTTSEEFSTALQNAFQYDRKILVEEAVECVEVECSVLGYKDIKASTLGSLKANQTFYTYDAKYLDQQGASFTIPAKIPVKLRNEIRKTAIKAFEAIGGEGLSRVDFFLRQDGTYVINEINTMPGFTSISMYPKLWEESKLPLKELLDQLILISIERYIDQQQSGG
ncbi:MAG: D-alanine--D-alanine ligase [Lewinellaceae bacterium]|nr:D-alanine--D-alanine ligase [Lewinellaceae bacterium]